MRQTSSSGFVLTSALMLLLSQTVAAEVWQQHRLDRPVTARFEPPRLTDAQLHQLLDELTPKRQELPWLYVDWELDLGEARARAAREDKPLLIISAADGNPVGRC